MGTATRRGAVAERQGRFADAIAAYSRALEQRPDWFAIANNLAWILATHRDAALRDSAKAIRLAEAATQGAGAMDPGRLDTLAAAYASARRFDEAVRTGQHALRQASVAGDEELARQIREHLAHYEAGRPYFD